MIRSFVIQGQAHDLYQEAFASSRGGQERSLTTRPSLKSEGMGWEGDLSIHARGPSALPGSSSHCKQHE